MIQVDKIVKNSCAHRAGFCIGDQITSVNGHKTDDDLDWFFWTAQSRCRVTIKRRNKDIGLTIIRSDNKPLGLLFAEPRIRRCRNRCIFCFIDQMPPRLRKSLYVKDEDIRHSFLNGSYVTLSSLTKDAYKKIIQLQLSPLYVSVHATDRAVRNIMLGNKSAPSIMEQLRRLENKGIKFHTQIVVCPGYNDGTVLQQTIHDLLLLTKGLLSIAVVPVGLTKFHKNGLRIISKEESVLICKSVSAISVRQFGRDKFRKLFLADEFFIKAGLPIPAANYYGDYPQIENGVGLIRKFLTEWKQLKKSLQKIKLKRIGLLSVKCNMLVLTSYSAECYVRDVFNGVSQVFKNTDFLVLPVKNLFFGKTVTVAGLLSAQDILSAIRQTRRRWDAVIVPAIIFNYRGNTLDGFSVKRLQKNVGTKLVVAKSLSDMVKELL